MPVIDITYVFTAKIDRVKSLEVNNFIYEYESELIKQNRELLIGEIIYVYINENECNLKISPYVNKKFNDLPYFLNKNIRLNKK